MLGCVSVGRASWLRIDSSLGLLPEAVPSVSANIATRLLQLHLCVIYLFGGLAKARGAVVVGWHCDVVFDRKL